jgi:hypothetical protein
MKRGIRDNVYLKINILKSTGRQLESRHTLSSPRHGEPTASIGGPSPNRNIDCDGHFCHG